MEEKKKSTAGRPPKRLTRKFENRKGIIDSASEPDVIFELIHDNLDSFKSLFESAKRINDIVKISISQTGIKIFCGPKGDGCYAIIDIYGHRVGSFYSSKNINYSCSAEKIIKILRARKKNNQNLIFQIKKNSLYTLYIIFILQNNIRETWEVPLDPCEDIDFNILENHYNLIDRYPLSFNIDRTFLKDTVNTWKQFTNKDIIFEKDPETDLMVSFQEGQEKCKISFPTDSIKIDYKGSDLFALSVPIISLLNISVSCDIGNNLTFYLHEDLSIIVISKLDESYESKNEVIPDSETMLLKYFVPL